MLNLFGWIRRRSCESFLAGIGDAIQQLASPDSPDDAPALAQLRLTLATPPAALLAPEPTPEAPARRGRKE